MGCLNCFFTLNLYPHAESYWKDSTFLKEANFFQICLVGSHGRSIINGGSYSDNWSHLVECVLLYWLTFCIIWCPMNNSCIQIECLKVKIQGIFDTLLSISCLVGFDTKYRCVLIACSSLSIRIMKNMILGGMPSFETSPIHAPSWGSGPIQGPCSKGL